MRPSETFAMSVRVDRYHPFAEIRAPLERAYVQWLDTLLAQGYLPVGRAELTSADDFARNVVTYTLTVAAIRLT